MQCAAACYYFVLCAMCGSVWCNVVDMSPERFVWYPRVCVVRCGTLGSVWCGVVP